MDIVVLAVVLIKQILKYVPWFHILCFVSYCQNTNIIKMKKAFFHMKNVIDNGFHSFKFEITYLSFSVRIKVVMGRKIIEFCQKHSL